MNAEKVKENLIEKLISLQAYINTSNSMSYLEYYMGGFMNLCGFGRENGLLSEDEWQNRTSSGMRDWKQRKELLERSMNYSLSLKKYE